VAAVQTPDQISTEVQAELIRRHKATAQTVGALLVLTLILALMAFLGKSLFRHQDNSSLDITLRITILIFGLGSVVLRRTRFSAMRLQDIAALKGTSGLLATLERTTLQVALLGAAIVVFGFIATLLTGNQFYAYGAGLVGFVVLLYCYPTRTSWQLAIQKFAADYPEATKPTGLPAID
jgi:hypothetical protein